MEINEVDLGKIVNLSVKPEWGLGIISKVENRFAYILFRGSGERTAKKYLRFENRLTLAKEQDQPDLNKRARAKNKKVKATWPKKPKEETAAKS